jgi:hypothetical protein
MTKAERLKVKEVGAVLDGQSCHWVLTFDVTGSPVFCEKPAWLKNERVCPSYVPDPRFCSYHAALRSMRAQVEERRRNITKFAAVEGKSRAEIVAVRDGEAA